MEALSPKLAVALRALLQDPENEGRKREFANLLKELQTAISEMNHAAATNPSQSQLVTISDLPASANALEIEAVRRGGLVQERLGTLLVRAYNDR